MKKVIKKPKDERNPVDIPEIDSNSTDVKFKEGEDTNSLEGYKELDTN